MHRQRMSDPLQQTGSALVVASTVDSKEGEKRHLQNNNDSEFTRPVPQVFLSPPQPQRKTVGRDGNADIACAKEIEVKTVAPVRGSVHKAEDEGQVGHQEINVPTASGTRLLERMSNVDPFISPYATSSTAGGAGTLPARMNPALMVKIDTPDMSTTSNMFNQPASTPFPPPAKQPKQNGEPTSSVPTIPFPKPMPEFATQHVHTGSTADGTIRDFERNRMKGVIGRSGNQIMVNGVTIPTGKGHGENQVDEAGQRELIEIIVDLHNKGISTAELSQLVNRVMTALAKPAPSHDPGFVTHLPNSSFVPPASVISSAFRENAASVSTVLVNSRRPGAADFMDLPPSRLASSNFFRSNASRAFAPSHPKQLVVELDHSFDEGPDSDVESNSDFKSSTSTAGGFDDTDVPHRMHSDEMRIAGEDTSAAALERGARLSTYAVPKKAVAANSAATDTSSTATRQSAPGARPRLSAKSWALPIYAKPSHYVNGANVTTASATSAGAPAQTAATGPDSPTVGSNEGATSEAKPARSNSTPAKGDSRVTETPLTTIPCHVPPFQNVEHIPSLTAVPLDSHTKLDSSVNPCTALSLAAEQPVSAVGSSVPIAAVTCPDLGDGHLHVAQKKKTHRGTQGNKEHREAKKAASLEIRNLHQAAGTWEAYKAEKAEKREREAEEKRARALAAPHNGTSPNQSPTAIATRQAPSLQYANSTNTRNGAVPSSFGDHTATASSAQSATSSTPRFKQANPCRGQNATSTSVPSSIAPSRANVLATPKHSVSAAGLAPNTRQANNSRRGWNRGSRREW